MAVLRPIVGEDVDLLTYVDEGAVAYEDHAGNAIVTRVGEVHRQTHRAGARQRGANPSSTSWARVFQVALRASAPSTPTDGPLLFTVAERRNLACLIASGSASAGGVRLRSDARVYSSILDPGHHLVHTLGEARGAWIHVVVGEATVNGIHIVAGDGAGVIREPAISVTAVETTEVLLIDVDRTRSVTDGRHA